MGVSFKLETTGVKLLKPRPLSINSILVKKLIVMNKWSNGGGFRGDCMAFLADQKLFFQTFPACF